MGKFEDAAGGVDIGLDFICTLTKALAESGSKVGIEAQSADQPAEILRSHHRALMATVALASTTDLLDDLVQLRTSLRDGFGDGMSVHYCFGDLADGLGARQFVHW